MERRTWQDALTATANPRARAALEELRAGHERFLRRAPRAAAYTPELLERIATQQSPIAAIVACSDSRVAPEIVFDQPLGSVFASRVPGNVASDSAKWMLDIAVTELRVPLVLVLGHTRCLAVGQIVQGKIGSGGGSLRMDIQKAVHRARMSNAEDNYRESVEENVALTLENLRRDSFAVQKAIGQGELDVLGGVYDMDTGEVYLLA